MSARLFDLGRALQSRVRTLFDTTPGPAAPPLELLHTALDELEKRVHPAGRGARIFPYNRLVVHISQPEGDRAAIEAVFRQFDARWRERLAELKCEAPQTLEASVAFAPPESAGGPVVAVECFKDATPDLDPQPTHEYPTLRVTVVKGQSAEAEYTFTEAVIAIGRTAEPVDASGRARRNHVAFLETVDGVTETVGRAHARLQFDVATRAYHLFNEANSNPTFVVRAGRSIRVPPRDPIGLRVESGDEVQLGRAIIRLTIG